MSVAITFIRIRTLSLPGFSHRDGFLFSGEARRAQYSAAYIAPPRASPMVQFAEREPGSHSNLRLRAGYELRDIKYKRGACYHCGCSRVALWIAFAFELRRTRSVARALRNDVESFPPASPRHCELLRSNPEPQARLHCFAHRDAHSRGPVARNDVERAAETPKPVGRNIARRIALPRASPIGGIRGVYARAARSADPRAIPSSALKGSMTVA
jgi:hypothetical protein